MGCLCSKTKSIPEDIDPKNLSNFVPMLRDCRVIKCYDGDTITVAAFYPAEELYKFSVRIAGIDCPEMKTKNSSEKDIAIIARDRVANLILGQMVELENVTTEKYGRLLANVIFQKQSVGDILLREHLAVEYKGGTKTVPDDWTKYHFQK